jgi:hypothetical protein
MFVRHLVAFESNLKMYITNGEAARRQLTHIFTGELDEVKPFNI